MPQFDPTVIGTALVILGLAAALLVLALLRNARPVTPDISAVPLSGQLDESEEAEEGILIVQAGGRVSYINKRAREYFKVEEALPSLETLSRKIRPSDSFFQLCTASGDQQVNVDGQAVHITSLTIPYGNDKANLLTFQPIQPVLDGNNGHHPGGVDSRQHSRSTANILSEMGQAMAASLDLDSVVKAILENIEKLISCDYIEITVFDADNHLINVYRLEIHAGQRSQAVAASLETLDSRLFTRQLIDTRKPILQAEVGEIPPESCDEGRHSIPVRSFLGVPLFNAEEPIGTIELGSLSQAAFRQNELVILQILSGSASIALKNALLYKKEQLRGKEHDGLARLVKTVGAGGEARSVYAQLIDSIAPLVDVEFLGFILYDDNRHTLEGQRPFLGLHEDVIEWTSTVIQPDSAAEQLWLSQEAIVATQAGSDTRLEAFGIDNLAVAAGINQIVLMPLSSGGRRLGYLLVGDKRDKTPFSPDDIRLISILADQTGPIVENAELIRQAEHRAQRAETLRRIASLTGSSATIDEILKYSLQDLGRLLNADKAGILLLDQNVGELRLHKPSLFGISPEFASRWGKIASDEPGYPSSATQSQTYLFSDDIRNDPRFPPLYHTMLFSLGIKSVIIAPLVARNRGIGEIVIGSYQPHFFAHGDVQTITTACGQLANVIESTSLYAQTDESLRQRVEQLTSLARFSRELNTHLDLTRLLQQVYNEMLQTTHADCGTIALFDIRASQTDLLGEDDPEIGWPEVLLQIGEPLPRHVHPLELRALNGREALAVDDYEAGEAQQPAGEGMPLQAPHDGVRASLIVPIQFQDKIAGLIHLHSLTPRRFDRTAKELGEALASQAAVVLGNAYRYQDLHRQSEILSRRVETLHRLLALSPGESHQALQDTLRTIACAIKESTQFDRVLVHYPDPNSGELLTLSGAENEEHEPNTSSEAQHSWESFLALIKPEYALGQAFFVPAGSGSSHQASGGQNNLWQPGDRLFIPLNAANGQLLGLLSLDEPSDRSRPTPQDLDPLGVFCQHAVYAIGNHQRMQTLLQHDRQIQDDLERAQQAAQTSNSYLPILLHKDLEQTIAVQQLSQRAARIRAGMDISELVNRQGERSSVLMVFARELLTRMDMDSALIVEPGSLGPHLMHSLGRVPGNIQIEALLGQRNPLLSTLQTGSLILVSRLEADSEWSDSPLLHALEAKSFVCIPIFLGARLDAVVLAVNQKPQAPFSQEDEQLFTLLARNVAITLQNLNLLLEISQHLAEVNLLLDFNRQLSNLEPERILQTLVESSLHVLPTAQASLVTLWDPKKGLLIPQASAGYANPEKIMQITYKPGEALPGKTFTQNQPIRLDEVNFPNWYNLSSEKLLNYHDAADGLLPISSMAVPIQKSPGTAPLGVLVVENFKSPDAFSVDAQALVTSLTQQTALNLENSHLYRAAELRASQLQALTGAAAIISSNLQPEELVGSLLDQLEAILPFKTGTLWLRQEERMYVHGTRGFADSDVRTGLSIAIDDSLLLQEMIDTRQPICVGDVSQDARFPSLVENPYPAWLGIPLVAGGGVIGVIALEMDEADFYNPEHIQIAMAFAGQAAVALENANLYQQIVSRAADLDQRSQRLEMLNRFSNQLGSSLDPVLLLATTLQEVQTALSCSAVVAVLFDPSGQALVQAEYPLREADLPLVLPPAPIFDRLRESLGVFSCEDVSAEEELAPIADYLKAWDTHSLLALPLATGSALHGILLVQSSEPRHFASDEVGLAKTIGNQAAIAIQNARLYAETSSLTSELDQRVRERTEQLARAHQRTEILLRLITELSASLDLEQVLTRTLKVLNQIIDAEHITVLLARTGEKKLHHLASVGLQTALTIDEFFTTLDPDQGLAGWIIQQRKPLLIPDVRDDPRWVELPNSTVEYRSAIGVPLLIGGVSLGALLFFHRRVDHFSMDQLDLVQAAANQVAIAVNNAELYRLIRDQAEDLGSMVRSQQIETQRTKAMLEDVADGVLVTDETMKITLFNDSAEKILGLNRSNVIGKSMEHFLGLFGSAAHAWIGTIRTWSQNPDTFAPGDTYAEQIELDDGRVVSVHLAPVNLRDNFLGTVSIFRDITHQVEVDRLKSEFVATVSHELRTPMTSIKGYVEILLMGAAGPLNDQQVHFLEIVKNNSERLAILVNDLLDISRIESGRLNLALQPMDVAPLAHEATTDLARRSQEDNKPMAIETDIPRSLPRVLGDPDQVRRIFDNLLENAYYYTAEGGRLLVRIRRAGEYLQIDVQDSGIGIPRELQPRVFERFFRGEHPFVLATSGTGLGLSIVQHLVEMHNGKIWLESSGIPGEGSTFTFTLPVYHPDD